MKYLSGFLFSFSLMEEIGTENELLLATISQISKNERKKETNALHNIKEN